MKRTIVCLGLLLVVGGLASGCRPSSAATPTPVLSGQRVLLERGLIEVEQGQREEPYYIETPSGALIQPPQPGTRFIVAVGADEVTVVQVIKGVLLVRANGDWVNLESDMQVLIRPGAQIDGPMSVEQYLDRETYLADPVLGE
ncbi:MAG: hypothetical protein DRI48_05505 [Chloroflexi bacterium]|nr:MAG: hypothetical protein DRI48_05505 [Chloroflexota bacterium]